MDAAAAREVFLQICERLHSNVRSGHPDQSDEVVELPAGVYRDQRLFEQEIENIFKKVPLFVALGCDLPGPGDFISLTIVGHPVLVVRGDDGVARAFLNICRHRGARLTDECAGNRTTFTCPYHAWSYDRHGKLKGIADGRTFGDVNIEGLIELPADETAGAVFVCLDRDNHFSAREWLGGMAESLESLRLDEMYPYRKTSTLESPNWKLAADGYLDGYHLGYLHRKTIGAKSITNRNTYDFFGPHMRIGFANKGITAFAETAADAVDVPASMSLVQYIFPNVSISGGHHDTIQLSRLFPGTAVDESTTVQHQYFREPVEGEMAQTAEAKRVIYEQVVRDEDCETIFTISEGLAAMDDMPVYFGRNEPANQHLHKTIQTMSQG